MFLRFFTLQGSRRALLTRAAFFTGLLALVDWVVKGNIYFGFLYLFSMLLVGAVLQRWQIALAAAFCAVLSELFGPFQFDPTMSLPQDGLLFIALTAVGLFSREVKVNQDRELENRRTVEREVGARREAEEQLQFLIQTSPIAILVMNAGGKILTGNSAAGRLLGLQTGELVGKSISRYIPALGRVPSAGSSSQVFRTEMQCHGRKDNGEVFLADVFFSTYSTGAGPRLAALVADASEDLRDRAEFGLEQLMTGSRILVGAVSHEVRNVCSAIAVVYENMANNGDFRKSQDFEALGSLVEALNRIASLDLKKSTSAIEAKVASLTEILDEARIVLEPYCAEADIVVSWDVPESLPFVWADRHSLLHVFLNLAKNSRRALANAAEKGIHLSISEEAGKAAIRFCDTGPGIASSEHLFQPMHSASEATGLGLFLSRAFMRSFGGDLRHEPTPSGCCSSSSCRSPATLMTLRM